MTQNHNQGVVLFDLDGTLIDSHQKLENDVLEAFQRLGMTINPEEAEDDWGRLAAHYGLTPSQFWASFSKREPWNVSLAKGKVKLYEDTLPVLKELRKRNYKLGIITRSEEDITAQKLGYFNLCPYFDSVKVTPLDRKKYHTKKDEAEKALDEILRNCDGITHLSPIYIVGDRNEDIQAAAELKQAHPTLLIYGVHIRNGRKPLQIASDYSIERLREFLPILEGNNDA